MGVRTASMITASATARDCTFDRRVDFILLTLGLLAVLFVIMVVLARAFQSHSVADLIDWKPTRSPEVEAQNEIDDVRQMIEAQNEYRRRRGAKEITEADAERQALEDQAIRARGRGPFAQSGGLEDPDPEPPRKPKRTKKAKKT
jgi:hypothetical protein